MRAISSRDSFNNLRNSAMCCWRWESGARRQVLKAPSAAAMASATSSAVDDWNRPRLLPRQAGFSFSNVAPLREVAHLPPMKFLKVSTIFGDGTRAKARDYIADGLHKCSRGL